MTARRKLMVRFVWPLGGTYVKLEKSDLLNYFLILAKLHICLLVDLKYRTEKVIGVKNYTQRKFQTR